MEVSYYSDPLISVNIKEKQFYLGLKYLQGEPLMITSSGDNTLKMWIFDMPDSGARLLRYLPTAQGPFFVTLKCLIGRLGTCKYYQTRII